MNPAGVRTATQARGNGRLVPALSQSATVTRSARGRRGQAHRADAIASDATDHQALLPIAQQPLRPIDAAAVDQLYWLAGTIGGVNPETERPIIIAPGRPL